MYGNQIFRNISFFILKLVLLRCFQHPTAQLQEPTAGHRRLRKFYHTKFSQGFATTNVAAHLTLINFSLSFGLVERGLH